jgi:formamidopyrimidine-DNA glycosylase
MPELPEVEALGRDLASRLRGRAIAAVSLRSFAALKTYDPPLQVLVGTTLSGCTRRGKFLAIEAGELYLVMHLARAGWVRWHDQLAPDGAPARRSPVALRVQLDSGAGFEVTEQGTEKRLSLYLVRTLEEVPGIARLGPDALDPGFDAAALAEVLRSAGTQPLKSVLTDQELLAGVGNAYSDEALHVARLSPYRRAGSLDASEVGQLHAALVGVLRDAVSRSDGLRPSELKGEKHAGMRVHGRAGQPCPVCGDAIREVAFSSRSFQYCPTCQTGGKVLADRRLSRLLR